MRWSTLCLATYCPLHIFGIPSNTQVRNWHNLMPNSASLKNAYRDRPPKKKNRGAAAPGSEDEDETPEEQKKVPQSFTFIRREGW